MFGNNVPSVLQKASTAPDDKGKTDYFSGVTLSADRLTINSPSEVAHRIEQVRRI